MNSNYIAYGILGWDSTERRSRRYGTINVDHTNFNQDASAEATIDHSALNLLSGQKVRLYAVVIQARESGHVGDLTLQVFPSRPEPHVIIELGVGIFFHEQNCIGTAIGLEPDDSRDEFWLDPRALYRLHDQTVAIYAEPTDRPHHVVEPFKGVEDGIKMGVDTRTGQGFYQTSGKNIIGVQKVASPFKPVPGMKGAFMTTAQTVPVYKNRR